MAPLTPRARPPRGWRRAALRLPVHLYRMGFGWLFGGRALLLTHTGRISGQPRKAVLEVVTSDPSPRSWTVASGYGPRAQWYRNLRHEPRALVQVRNRYHAVSAHFCSAEEGGEILAGYAALHPRSARVICRHLGLPCDGSPESFREAGLHVPFVRLTEYPAT